MYSITYSRDRTCLAACTHHIEYRCNPFLTLMQMSAIEDA